MNVLFRKIIKDYSITFKKPVRQWDKLDYYFLNISAWTLLGTVYGIHRGKEYADEELQELIEKQKKHMSMYLPTSLNIYLNSTVPIPYYVGSMSILGICMGVSGFAFGVWSPLLIPYIGAPYVWKGFKEWQDGLQNKNNDDKKENGIHVPPLYFKNPEHERKSLVKDGKDDKDIKYDKDMKDNKDDDKNWIIETIIDIIESKK